jgi:4-amino-4-deoxy-L-arabinose transferase-like glycosyltransferase
MSQSSLRPKRRQRDTALIILLVILILALATGLRFNQLGNQSLWADEGNSAAMAGRSLSQIAFHAANDIHPPLYYWLLSVWARIAGTSEAGLRSFSAILGILLVLGTIGLGVRLGGALLGLVAGLIAAVSPLQVYYSQEARMYILVALEGVAAVYAFWWLIGQEDRQLADRDAVPGPLPLWPAPLSLSAAAWITGLYTHYAFPVLIGFLSTAYLVWLVATWPRGAVGRRLARWGLLLGVTLLAYAPWLGIAIRQIAGWPTGGRPTDLGQALPAAVMMLSQGPLGLRPDLDLARQWWLWLPPALAVVGLLPWRAVARRPAWLSWLLPIGWLAAPLGMMLIFGLFREAYLKFLLIASPAFVLLLARGAVGPARTFGSIGHPAAGLDRTTEAVDPRLLRGGDILGVVWCVAALSLVVSLSSIRLDRYFFDPKAARDDYRGIAEFITVTAGANDVILLVAPGQAEVFNYYYKGGLPVSALPTQRPMDRAATEPELDKLLARDKIYAVYWGNFEADPSNFIESWMNSHGYKTLDQWRGNVRLVVYVMPARRPTDEVVDGLNLPFGPDIILKGYRGSHLTPMAGEVTQLQLVWQALREPTRRYKVFMQLLDSYDQVVAQRDSEPVGDSRPTTTWDPGETVLDNHGVLLPPGTPPGDYRRIVGLYDAETGVRLRLPDGRDHFALPPVRVTRSLAPPPLAALNMMREQRFDFGAISLLGYDRYKRGFGHAPETPLYPGDRLHLTFYWQANVRPRATWWFDLTLSDSRGHAVANLRWPLVGETYPSTAWMQGEVVRGEHDLQISSDTLPGDYRLSLTMYPDEETDAGTAYLGTVIITNLTQRRNP